ncbi:MAG: hypothetical protein MUF63_05100 [Rhodobacteraceae bacterium]|jgi:hypothetical protein|nr:hypothetical protein [Paracoccaceae bacterium]
MTTVITRLYADEEAARAIVRRLSWEGLPARALQVISSGGRSRETIAEKMQSAGVHVTAVPAYSERVAGGNALLVVRATYKPLGAAQIARDATARSKAIEVRGVIDDYYFADPPDNAPSVLKDHPRFLSLDLEPGEYKGGPISAELGIPLLTRGHRNRPLHVFKGGKFVSRAFWPMPLLSRKRKANSAIHGGRYMSKLFWPMPLITKKERTGSVIRGGALPFSRAFGMPTIIRRPTDGRG